MLGKTKTLEILKEVLHYSSADQTEAILSSHSTQLTRFANSSIHQNLAEENNVLMVKMIFGKKIGFVSSNLLDKESIKETVNKAFKVAKLQRENPDFKSLPMPSSYKKLKTYFEETVNSTPFKKAEEIKKMCLKTAKQNLILSGSYTTELKEIGIMNSLGIEAFKDSTLAHLVLVVMDNYASSGYNSAVSYNITQIQPEETLETAIKKCLKSKNKIAVEPKEYTVILEEEAVASLLYFLAYLGFGALSYQENRSFMNENLGKKIMDEKISITDDATDEEGLAFPFDLEGVAKQRVELVKGGIACGVVYDSYTAFKENRTSTGHSIGSQNIEIGPLPTNLFITKGNTSLEEMISSVDYGLLITRFHYLNIVEPISTTVTGMTRDGTFLIEAGKITKPVYNLRFTESILKVFNEVDLLSSSRKRTLYSFVPAMKVNCFRFTGQTEG